MLVSPSFIRCFLVLPLLLSAAIVFSLFFFPRGQGVFWNIEFFRDIFLGKPLVNFHQCCIFHVQCMFAVTSLIPWNAGHFFKITATTTLHSYKIKLCETFLRSYNVMTSLFTSLKTNWKLTTCSVTVSLLRFQIWVDCMING